MKSLGLVMLMASPAVAAWALRGGEEKAAAREIAVPAAERVAVEVLAADGKKEWMMVEVPRVPEPSSAVLMMLSTLLLLRRNRGK